jgi:hypothetical protein
MMAGSGPVDGVEVTEDSLVAALAMFGFGTVPEFSDWLGSLDPASQEAVLAAFVTVLNGSGDNGGDL